MVDRFKTKSDRQNTSLENKSTKGIDGYHRDDENEPVANWTDRRSFDLASIRWKILVIALVTSVAFSAYLAFNLVQSNFQAFLLEDIHQKRYPVQIKLQEAFFTLRLIQSKMQDAVLTGELEGLQETQHLKMQFLDSMIAVQQLDNTHADTTSDIISAFTTYFNNSFSLASDLVSGKAELAISTTKGQENFELYARLVSHLDAFKASEQNSFSQAVSLATERANSVVSIGVPAGILTMLMVFGLASVTSRRITGRISHMVHTLRVIAQDNGDMSVRIPVEGRDEMAALAFWFNQFIQKLERITTESTTEIRRLAYTDALTQLPNRRLFNTHLKAAVRHCHQYRKTLAVMFLDLDNFKAVNDQMGHDAGDILVCEVGKRLAKTVRGNDLVAHDLDISAQQEQHMVARMGGDEFMLIISDLQHSKQVEIVAERVRQTILDPIVIDGITIEIGVSIGIALYPDNGSSAEELVVNADLAMYEAKNRGKNNYCLFNDQLEDEVKLKLQIESELRNALINDELELFYQPKFNIEDLNMVGAEALLRWHSPTLGPVSPAQFIPIAENSGLIYEIDEWVIRRACKQFSEWISKGFNPLPLAVNVSAKQAARGDLARKIQTAIECSNLPPYSLEIEITETSAISNMQLVAENIRTLKDLKVTVALDDFGAGHSSLSLLKYCDIDTLKIDRGFLSELNNQDSKPIYKAVIELAKTLNIQTVAEGIEQQSELETLRKNGMQHSAGISTRETNEYQQV